MGKATTIGAIVAAIIAIGVVLAVLSINEDSVISETEQTLSNPQADQESEPLVQESEPQKEGKNFSVEFEESVAMTTNP